jgi:hypothetical protein
MPNGSARIRPIVEELESRILYSADLTPGLAATPTVETRFVDTNHGVMPAARDATWEPLELVVVDARVADADLLLASLDTALGRRFEVIRLTGDEDGIARIGEAFRGHADIAALHVIAHGEAGQIGRAHV